LLRATGGRRRAKRRVILAVMGIRKYLVELDLNIHLHFLDGGIYRMLQIYRFRSLNNTVHQNDEEE